MTADAARGPRLTSTEGPMVCRAGGPSSFRRSSMNCTPENPAPGGCARETSSSIEHLHPTTKIKQLREYYGGHFANGWAGESTLGELLKENRFTSLTEYVRHFRHRPLKRF